MHVSFYCMFPLFLIVSCIFFIILYYVYDFVINNIHSLAVVISCALSTVLNIALLCRPTEHSLVFHNTLQQRNIKLWSQNIKCFWRLYMSDLCWNIIQLWSPHLKCDIERIEKVQRQFTKRLYGFKHLCYEERLTKLRIPSLELRRLYLDLTYCYKMYLDSSLWTWPIFRVFTVYRHERTCIQTV